MVVYMTCW